MTGSVEPPPEASAGPPAVIKKGCPKRLKEAIIEIVTINSMTGLSRGSVTNQKDCQPFEPSTCAASYSSVGIFCKAARKIIILKPSVHQMVATTIATQAQGCVESH